MSRARVPTFAFFWQLPLDRTILTQTNRLPLPHLWSRPYCFINLHEGQTEKVMTSDTTEVYPSRAAFFFFILSVYQTVKLIKEIDTNIGFASYS